MRTFDLPITLRDSATETITIQMTIAVVLQCFDSRMEQSHTDSVRRNKQLLLESSPHLPGHSQVSSAGETAKKPLLYEIGATSERPQDCAVMSRESECGYTSKDTSPHTGRFFLSVCLPTRLSLCLSFCPSLPHKQSTPVDCLSFSVRL